MLGGTIKMEEISIIGKEGEPIIRSNLVVCFFGQTTVPKWAATGTHVLKEWLKLVPDETLKWTLIGASASTFAAINSRSVERCFALMDAKKSKLKELTSFELLGPEKYGAAFSFSWKADPDSGEQDSEYSNFLEMRFPAVFLDQFGVANFVDWMVSLASEFSYDSGYSAIALFPCRESVETEAGMQIGPLALRHFGYDVSNNRRTSFDLRDRCRGAQWITFLGNSLVERLGGSAIVSTALAGYDVRQSASGIAIIAFPYPVIGDSNRNNRVDELKPIAKLLEPLTYFGDYGLDSLFMDDEDKRERWERRFLD